MKTFFNLFQKFLENKTELSEFFDLPVQSCKINRQSRIMIIQMLSKKYYNFQQITAVEKTIKKDFNLALAKVEFVYEDLPFSADYCEDIAELLKREHPKLNGFLNKAKYTFADDVLSIELQNGGLSVILDTGIDKLLKDYINGHFQTHIKINFGGITETTEKMLADNSAIAKP